MSAVAPGDPVAVTGAAGFIGSAITRCLLERGARVVALSEPAGDRRNLDGLDVEIRSGDVRDRASVEAWLAGCRYVFHAAALYGFWAKDRSTFYDVNVNGTRNVLAAATAAGCERIVYTGTVGTLGLGSVAAGELANEECAADIAHLFGDYKRSKYVAEHEVLRAAAQGVPVSLALPTFPLGPCDRRPTPTGKVVVDFLNGRMPGFVDTAMNVVHVDDLASGHVLVLERGQVGRSYILGGENLSMHGLLDALADVSGRPRVTRLFPRLLPLVAGAVTEAVQGRLLGTQPFVPMEAARMSTTEMMFDDRRARSEIGYRSRPAVEAIADSVRWFTENGYANSDARPTKISARPNWLSSRRGR